MTRAAPISLVLALLLALAPLAPTRAADEPLRTPPDRAVDITRIALDLAVDLKQRSIEGTAVIDLRAVAPVEVVRLDAVEHEVRAVRVKLASVPEAVPVRFAYDGEVLSVPLDLARGAEARIEVEYRVRDPQSGLYFFGPTEDAPDVPWQAWTQGETTHNRRWFPCVDHPDERQATALTVRVADGLTVISNGVLLGKEPDAQKGRTVWRFVQEREHVAYLVTLVVGTFAKAEDRWRDVPLATYVPPERAADAARSFARTKDMLEFFSEKTGVDYPWKKYDQVVVEQFIAGGMENTGATTLNERTLHDARAHLDYSSEGLVAHELAHQWYGDLLTCRDWAHIWLNESFATFFDALWTEHAHGADEYAYEMLQNAARGEPAGKTRPILDRRYPDPNAMFDGRAYPKGSCVLHMLRRQLGEDAFWRGIQAYTRELQGRSVETVDLRRALERASGRNLERFFYDWVERPGHPDLEVRLSHDAERGQAEVTIRQRQESEPYAFPAELLFGFGDERVVRAVDVSEKEHRFVFACERAPTLFRFDPREAVLLKDVEVHKGHDLWLRQLADDAVPGRIHAARALAKTRRPDAVEAVVAALAEDAFWGVRAESASALADVGGAPARDALIAGLKQEHPKVRRACAEALARRGPDPHTAAALAAVLTAGDPSYYVEAACIEVYASASKDPLALLEAQLGKPSHNEVVRIAALRGLRRLDDLALIPRFVELLAPSSPSAVRQQAARALSLAGLPGAPDAQRLTAVRALERYLGASDRRGRRAALDGLSALGRAAREALDAVERVARLDPEDGLRRKAAQVAERIRSDAPPERQLTDLREDTQRLVEQTRRLEEEKARLEERLERVEASLGNAPTPPAEVKEEGK